MIILNGEIYNYIALKDQLNTNFNDITWKGTSDTEVLINCIEKFGLIKTLDMVSGMFAFVLFDQKIQNPLKASYFS